MRITTMGAVLLLALATSTPNRAWQRSDAQKPEAQNPQVQNPPTQNVQAKTVPLKGGAPAPLIPSIKGADLFHAYCASCHGTDAKGGGPMAPSLKVAPADLTRISARNGGVFPKMRMERIISGEEQPALGHGSIAMPVWGPIFSKVTTDVDLGLVRIDNLARYLNSIQQTK
jgi:mono/diheme cytochrome c family protein